LGRFFGGRPRFLLTGVGELLSLFESLLGTVDGGDGAEESFETGFFVNEAGLLPFVKAGVVLVGDGSKDFFRGGRPGPRFFTTGAGGGMEEFSQEGDFEDGDDVEILGVSGP
jgi:hypothetical protein